MQLGHLEYIVEVILAFLGFFNSFMQDMRRVAHADPYASKHHPEVTPDIAQS